MNSYDLFHMARITGALGTGCLWTPERFIYDSYRYAELHVTTQEIMDEVMRIFNLGQMSDVVMDHCIAVLSGRAKPLWAEKGGNNESA